MGAFYFKKPFAPSLVGIVVDVGFFFSQTWHIRKFGLIKIKKIFFLN